MSHEHVIRSYFVKAINSMVEHIWRPERNVFVALGIRDENGNATTANGKPDGEVRHHGKFIGVEFKAGEETNGIWSFASWRENQRACYRNIFLATKSPYLLCVGFWLGSYRIPNAKVFLLPAETWLDMETWVKEGTGMGTVAADEEHGIGSRKSYNVEAYLKAFPQKWAPTCTWRKGQFEIKGLWSE